MSEETAPTTMVRRLVHQYGWLLAAVALAVVVLACSVPFVTGAGMSWNSGDPFAAPVQVTPAADSTTGVVPEKSAGPPTSAAPPAAVEPEATRRRTTSPAARPTTEKAPTALGPDGGATGLWRMLRAYCATTYRTAVAQLRHGAGQAENNWECRRRGEHPLIDMHAACRRQYGREAFAQYSNRNDAFSWRCYRHR